MRKPHLWKASKGTEAPSNVLHFDCETTPTRIKGPPDFELHKLRLGHLKAYRLDKGRRSREHHATFRTAEHFWQEVAARLDRKRPLWVFAHNLPFDLGCVGGWNVLTSERCAWTRWVIDGGLTYLKGTMDGRPIVLCDSCNYYHCSLASVGRSVGLPKGTMPGWTDTDSKWEEYCERDVAILAEGMDSLVRFHREHRLGPWGPSIASLCFGALRSRFLRHDVFVHCYREPLLLERAAYYGGRVDTPYIGPVSVPVVYECDVSSHYPACCMEPLPCRFMGSFRPRTASHIVSLLARGLITADVTLNTDNDTYPIRHGHSVYYPTGRYRTALADAEFRRAWERGHVVKVHSLTLSRGEPIFREHMEYFYSLKVQYEREGNDAFRTIAKYFMNALYGKSGQLSPRWMSWGPEAMEALERALKLPEGSLLYEAAHPPRMAEYEGTWTPEGCCVGVPIRNYWGQVEVCVSQGESRDSVPAIAAAVTSLGRVRLCELQEAAGSRHWYYSDTDSLWVDADGLTRLRGSGRVVSGVMGKLELKSEHKGLVIYGPKDYESVSVKKLKGIRDPFSPNEDGSYTQLHFPSLKSQLRHGLTEGVRVDIVRKTLRRALKRQKPIGYGWYRPLCFPGECPESGLPFA